MAGYTRQSTFADGDTITAALFNNEYNQLVNAFSNTTGHSHDGTAASGPVIGLIGDAGETSPNNKVLIDTTNNYIEFYVEVSSAPVQQLYIADGAIIPVTDSDIDLGTTSLRFKDTYTDTITTTGNVDVGGNLTVTGTTTFNGGTITMGDAATDNVVFGADVDSNIIPDDDDSYDLGSASQEWRNLYIDGTANIDSLVADTADINGGTIDGAIIGGSSAAAITGTTITGTSFVIGSADISEAELEILDGATVTTDELNILDGVTATTAELNLMDGVTSTTAELNILDGVTSTAAELNILDGVTSTAAELNILDGVTSTATELNLLDGVTATTSELNILDGVTASAGDINLIDGITNGTVIASKAIITDANKDISGGRNITITGELDAATLDISGDADIDGTLEADAITIGGITLAETISDTVGAMVSSNTETNITVSYDDADNTLDFVIGTLNQDTTGNAATATALETARTIHGVSFDGTANIDLSEVIADTVGAMVSSNTETNITVAYQDDDNTLDFTIGTLNQDTTGNAATATALETARTIGGTSFDGTANIAVNLSATATALATARTIGGVSFDGTANIVPTTFNAATFSGDLNVDSGVLFADVSTNRVGINQASPDVSLDVGSNTDAIHVPSGTTAERPASPAAGYFRYNSTTGDFEGYTDAWGAIAGGGGGTAPAIDTMTGDGSDTTLTLTSAPVNENATVVTIDGVVQHKDTYSVSSNTLTFSEAPPTGTAVECITWTNTAVNSALLMQDADGDTQIQVEESSDEDKIRFDTGGTERMIINSTGVGIGTTSPTRTFEVNSGTTNVAARFESTDSRAVVEFKDPSGTAELGGIGSDIYFAPAGAEKVRITSSGNVGIGTSSPSGVLTSYKSANSDPVLGHFYNDNAGTATEATVYITNSSGINDGLFLGTTGASFTTASGFVQDSGVIGTGTGASGGLSIMTRANADMRFYTNGHTNERMRIDSSGNVGIGTSSPSAPLTVSGADGTLAVFTNASDADFQFKTASGVALITPSTGTLAFGTSGTERMRINATGQLLVNPLGVSTPSFAFTNDTNTGITRPTGDTLQFVTGGSERMRIASNGRISMGTTTANAGLTVANGDIRTTAAAVANDANSFSMSQESSGGALTARGANTSTRGTISLNVSVSNGGNGLVGLKIDNNGDLLAPNLYGSAASQNDVRYNPTSGLIFYNTSSRRYKENIQDIPDGILTKINQARAVTFDEIGTDVQSFGLIAEELDALIPELVTRKEVDGAIVPDGITYSMLSVYLLKAIQEQQTQIDALQSEINLLKGE